MINFNEFLQFQPNVKGFFDTRTNTISYVVYDPKSKKSAVIDSVMDYEPNGATAFYESADKIINYINENQLILEWILETHVHADHLSAAQYIKNNLGGKIAIGKNITEVQKLFSEVFEEDKDFPKDGSQFDQLFEEGDNFNLGEIPVSILYTPGHTPADYTFIFGNAVFTGDTVFMPDFGSARCDFPKGSATLLYQSVQKIFALPVAMRVFICHDYLPETRKDFAWETTIAEQKNKNIHLKIGTTLETFVQMRTERDKKLDMPKLIIPSIQVNIRAGLLPQNSNQKTFLKIPVNNIFSKQQ